jgi:cell division transport system permease protein
MRSNLLVTSLTVGTITLALLILSLFLMVFINLEKTTDEWSTRVEIIVYFEHDVPAAELATIKTRIMALPGTARTSYVSKEEAIRRFRQRLKGQESLLDGVAADVLPASLEIALKRDFRSSQAIESYVGSLRQIPGVSEVQYGEEWVRRFTAFMQLMRFIGFVIGGFLVLAVVFIVSNTIKLAIFARRDELEILGLVGATRMFIKTPFLLEGIFQGAAGGVLAILLLGAAYLAIINNAGNVLTFNPLEAGLAFLPLHYCLAILAGGILLGFIGSLTSLKRFISV